jgi:hypothetical protein
MEDQSIARQLWVTEWLKGVADESKTMSQRKLSSVERHGGGMKAASKIAKSKGVHLLLLKDEKGTELVAASKTPFKVIC